MPPAPVPLLQRLFFVIGGACVVAGGLVAAVTGPLQLEHGSWAAAYLVLVAGVTQIAFAAGQLALAPSPPSPRVVAGELLGWNLGSAAVITGTIVREPLIVDFGGVLLVVALALFILSIRGAAHPRWALWLFRGVVVVMMVSIPIGLVLAHVRAA